MISLLFALVLGQTNDIETLNRQALAQLPASRVFKASWRVAPNILLTLTYDQTWYQYAKESELYPQKFLGNEDGWIDVWREQREGPSHILRIRVGHKIPGWDRVKPVFTPASTNKGGVLAFESPTASVPIVEIYRVRSTKPYVSKLYGGLGTFKSAHAQASSIFVCWDVLTVNRKEFDNMQTRFTRSERTLKVPF